MKKRNIFVMVCIMAMSIGLCACAGNDSDEVAANAVVETESTVQQTEEMLAEIVETTEEIVKTTTEEEEASLYIPEGVDVNSTLSGEEWLCTFENNVKEPVVVVFSDITGRKEVVQANSEITINPDEDIFGIYWNEFGMGETTHAISTEEVIIPKRSDGTYMELAHMLTMNSEKMRDIPERDAKVRVMGGEEDWVLEFKILVE